MKENLRPFLKFMYRTHENITRIRVGILRKQGYIVAGRIPSIDGEYWIMRPAEETTSPKVSS